MNLPKHYDTANLLDMVYWCRVLRKRYELSGNRSAVEKTYTLCSRIRKTREKESYPLTEQAMEGFHVHQRPEDDEPGYR